MKIKLGFPVTGTLLCEYKLETTKKHENLGKVGGTVGEEDVYDLGLTPLLPCRS